MNILFSESKTLSQVKQFTGYTSNEKEFIVYAEWDIDDGWFVHGVMFTEPDYNETEEEVDEVTAFFYKHVQSN
jgi:hypothetical protein